MYIVEYIKIQSTKPRWQANFTNAILVCTIYTFEAPVQLYKLLSLLTFTSQTFNKRKIEIKLFRPRLEQLCSYLLIALHELRCIARFSSYCRSSTPVPKLQAHQTDQQQGEKHASNVSRLPSENIRNNSRTISTTLVLHLDRNLARLLLMQFLPLTTPRYRFELLLSRVKFHRVTFSLTLFSPHPAFSSRPRFISSV